MNTKIIYFLLTFVFILTFTISTNADNSHKYKTVKVQKGDTLWNIALQNTEDSDRVDIREVVHEIILVNSLPYNSAIIPGQSLKIPVK